MTSKALAYVSESPQWEFPTGPILQNLSDDGSMLLGEYFAASFGAPNDEFEPLERLCTGGVNLS